MALLIHELGSISSSKQRDTLSSYTKCKPGESLAKKKKKWKFIGGKKSIRVDSGFSLAELWCFLLAEFVAGQEGNLPSAGLVK